MTTWSLECSSCANTAPGDALASLCPKCSQPYYVRYSHRPSRADVESRADLWRYAAALPLSATEQPVSLGEGMTPMIDAPSLAREIGIARLLVKDEAINPTVSFKARGMSTALTRAKALGVKGITVPTAGNAGAAVAAYAAAAGLPARVFAPATTPRPILETIRALGAELHLVDGHIGDAGKAATQFATEAGYFNVATVREPYRVEGMKTMGFEVAEQLGWQLPDVVVYPTGGGEGVIGIWKAFGEMIEWGWLPPSTKKSRMVVAQAAGCAPLVRAFRDASDRATPWENPVTHAWGLRVPSPLGDRMVLRALRESGGDAEAIDEETIRSFTLRLATATGIDAAPEGGAGLATIERMRQDGRLDANAVVVLFNTGSGASYR